MDKRLENGYIQVYTGNGKGKTTAALGLTLRAVGAGLRVFFAQFTKGRICSEHDALKRLAPQVRFAQYGSERFIFGAPSAEDVAAARQGLQEVGEVIRRQECGVVVLDEANVAVKLGLLAPEDLLALMDEKPPAIELIITGRDAHPSIIERADLVTEMRCLKHYYETQGVAARTGIEC
jgi:cob(I)alamin adenosyltransferase